MVFPGDIKGRIGQILGQDAARGTGDDAKRHQPSRRAALARDRSKQGSDGNPRGSLAHIRPPPGIMPGTSRDERREDFSRMAGMDCETFTGVMLS
jgi:hypothetical protein